jgi:putative pyruvate formate lyase activating enzyme
MLFAGSMSCCRLCPRECGIDRASGETGFCGAGNRLKIFAFGPHRGEEPPVSGRGGSGTIFFSGCTLRCMYCQNYRWSQDDEGTCHDVEDLVRMLEELHESGCHNWNLVSPTPWLPFIGEAIGVAKSNGISLPVVYNTSGFERIETLSRLSGIADIYLTDLRYAREETAALASQAQGYVGTAREALKEMWRQAGPIEKDADGAAVSGTICRILVLPGHADEAVANLEWLAENIGTDISVSVMSQYMPAYRAEHAKTWGRRISRAEYVAVTNRLAELDFAEGWTQEYDECTSGELIGFNMAAGRPKQHK